MRKIYCERDKFLHFPYLLLEAGNVKPEENFHLPASTLQNGRIYPVSCIITLFLITCCTCFSIAQINLPKGFAPFEEQLMQDYLNSRASSVQGITTPPFSPVRTMAEWEEIQAIAITWTSYTSTLTQIVKNIQSECKVFIICTDSNSVKNTLTSANVPLTSIRYLQQPYNSVWIRDYGANTVYTNDVDSLLLIDWIYNRPRPKDDVLPQAIATYVGVPLYSNTISPYNLMNTGGNFMSDGFGNAFASKLVMDENDGSGSNVTLNYPNHTEQQLDSIMYKFMGLKKYIKMQILPYDGIHHIDMHIKLLDEETLLVGQYPSGISDGPQIEANLQYVLSNFTSMFGSPYKVVRIPMPPNVSGLYPNQGAAYMTYANSTIANKTVLLPSFSEKYDTTAKRIYRENMPGYNVIGIDCNQIIQAGGALHCVTKEVGVAAPLLISHQRLSNTLDTVSAYKVDAYINHKTGIFSAEVYYTTDTASGFQIVSMSLVNAGQKKWTGYIPAKPVGSTVYYYIHAVAGSGKQQVRPMTAPVGFWQFDVKGITGIENFPNDGAKMLTAFPNPARAITCIPVASERETKGTLKLFDVNGKEVVTIYDGVIPSGEKNFFINASSLVTGAYILLLETENHKDMQKLMVWK